MGNAAWVKGGPSGNPGGRPAARDVAAIARRYTPDAINALVEICRYAKDNPGARVAAALGLLDRGWGKPKQDIDLSMVNAGNALHLHLYAVQRLEAARMAAESLEGDAAVAEPEDSFAEDLFQIPISGLPHEALPLWDAAVAAAIEVPKALREGEPPAETPAGEGKP